jgi:hypothetical protein
MTLPNHLAALEGKETYELIARRQELVNKAKNASGVMQATTLPDNELSELVAIFGILRRRASPSAAKGKTPPKTMDTSAVPADL